MVIISYYFMCIVRHHLDTSFRYIIHNIQWFCIGISHLKILQCWPREHWLEQPFNAHSRNLKSKLESSPTRSAKVVSSWMAANNSLPFQKQWGFLQEDLQYHALWHFVYIVAKGQTLKPPWSLPFWEHSCSYFRIYFLVPESESSILSLKLVFIG